MGSNPISSSNKISECTILAIDSVWGGGIASSILATRTIRLYAAGLGQASMGVSDSLSQIPTLIDYRLR